MITRHSILRAIPALIAAPAIVKAASLMPVKSLDTWEDFIGEDASYTVRTGLPLGTWRQVYPRQNAITDLYGHDMTAFINRAFTENLKASAGTMAERYPRLFSSRT